MALCAMVAPVAAAAAAETMPGASAAAETLPAVMMMLRLASSIFPALFTGRAHPFSCEADSPTRE